MRSLQHYALAVPDPAVGKDFYTDFGLEAREGADSIVMRCASRDQDQVMLVEGRKKHLHHICLGTREEEIDGTKKGLEARGVELVDPPREAGGDGLWFRDPDGLLVNLRAAADVPVKSDPDVLVNAPGHAKRLNARGCPEAELKAKPRRLGHILLFTPDVPAKVDFYTRGLGMKLSDTIAGDQVAFLRCGNGGDHHVIALLHSEKPGFHHGSFELGTIDEIEMGAAKMVDKGHAHCWGFGRHIIGSNFFHYVRDPWGSLAEYFTDIDIIAEDADWEPEDWEMEGSFYRWSTDGPPPEDFGWNSEA